MAPFYRDTDANQQGTLHNHIPHAIPSQDKWSPLTALVWQKPPLAASVQWIAPPAFTSGKDWVSVSTSHHSSLLPQKPKSNSLQRRTCGQKNKEGHWLQVYPKNFHTEIAHTPVFRTTTCRVPHHQGGGDRGVQLMLTRSSIRITLKNNGPWRLHKCYRKITSDFNVLHDHTALCFNYNLSFMPKDI